MEENGLIRLLSQLVAVRSVNPAHSDDAEHTGEQEMAEFTGNWLEKLGFSVEYQAVEPGRPNVLARYGDFSQGRILLLESHLDTVSVEGMKHHPFEATIRDNRLYARGASDCKGAMAAALYALSQVDLPAIAKAGCGILFIGAMGEETGNCGAQYFVKNTDLHISHSIILEPTDLEIIHTHKGVLWCDVLLKGHSAHGSHPENGVNAITAVLDFVGRMRERMMIITEADYHPVLGAPTLNVGKIQGGTAVNIVPAECCVSLDRRMIPGEHADVLLRDMASLLDMIKADGGCLDYTIAVQQQVEPFDSAFDSPLVCGLQQGCSAAGFEGGLSGAAWCSDAAILAACSDHTVVFGPGSIRQAHAAEEYIDLDELCKGSEALKNYFTSGCW